MAISKIIYKASASATPETWMDVTQDTVTASTLLSTYTATKNDGTKITGEYEGVSLQSKSATYTPTTSTQTSSILPDSGYALSSVGITVNPIPSAYIIPSGTLSISQNGSGIDVASYASVDVNVAGGGGDGYTAVLTGQGNSSYCYFQVGDTKYYSAGTFSYSGGESAILYGYDLDIDGVAVYRNIDWLSSYAWTLPYENIADIYLSYNHGQWTDGASVYITTNKNIKDVNGIIARTISGSYTNSIVSVIGSYAFYYCTKLPAVSFPNCTSIGSSAFYSCSALSAVSFPNCTSIGPYAFYSCTALPAVSFPNCTSIGSYAFYYCTKLSAVSFPNCTSIGSYAFYNCTALSAVSFPNCTSIGSFAFSNCTELSAVSFPNCIQLGSGVFSNCIKLTTAYLPSISIINNNVFYYCASLTDVTTAPLYSIGSSAFCSCTKLSSFNFSTSMSAIGASAFTNTKLSVLNLGHINDIGSVAFRYCNLLSEFTAGYVGYIRSSAFADCGLQRVSIISATANIFTYGTSAFLSCTSLSSVYISQYMSKQYYSVAQGVFYGCTNLKWVCLTGVKTFTGSSTFYRCYNLLSLYILTRSTVTPTLGNANAFTDTPISTRTTSTGGVYGSIFVPASMYASYIAATNWATYSDRFVSMTDAEIETFLSSLT